MTLKLHQIQQKGVYTPKDIETEDIRLLNDGTKKLSSILSEDSLHQALDDSIIFSQHGTGTEIFMKNGTRVHVVESKYIIERMMIED